MGLAFAPVARSHHSTQSQYHEREQKKENIKKRTKKKKTPKRTPKIENVVSRPQHKKDAPTTKTTTHHCFKGTQDVPQNADGFVRSGNHVVASDPTGDRVQQLHQILRQQTHHLRGQGVGQGKGGRLQTHVAVVVAAHGNAPQRIRLHLWLNIKEPRENSLISPYVP